MPSTTLEIRLLGPVEARLGGRPLALVAAKQRALLAMLALEANRTLSLDRLIEGLWGERPPVSAAKNVQLYVSQLRRLFSAEDAGATIATRGRGYELRVDPEAIDVARFERLLAEAGRAPDASASASAARTALALWRGPALADVAGEAFAAVEARRLEELRLNALELAIEGDVAAGRHREVIGELDSLLAERPWRERLHALRMLALYRSGRQAEALAAYRNARRALSEEIGVEPGHELQELHAAILHQDAGLRARPELAAAARTFLVAEVDRSTRRLAQGATARYADALERVRRALRQCSGRHGGVEVGTDGELFFIVFGSAQEAAVTAREVQEALALAPLRLRIGLHSGEARRTAGEYVGDDIHLAIRLCAAAHGGQVLLSQATRDLVEIETHDLGLHRLEDLDSPERLYQLGHRQFPPPRTLSLFGGEPPLIGRADELALATRALAEHGCVLFGAAGVGKSRLAAEAARLAAGGAGVERVIATESVRPLPFGAFSHLLPPELSASPIPAAIAALRERSPGRAPIVLVDDAHLLDPASAALVLALASTGTARPLLTIRSGLPVPDALVALWKDRGLLRLDLQPLGRDEVAELVDAFLAGPADGAVHRRAFELSQGNPLYVREFLADADHSGALTRTEGLWSLSGERPRLERLRELIATRTRDLTPAARRGLELLALCSPLALTELRDLAGSEAIEELERAGLAAVAGDRGDETVALAHPLHGEVVREELADESRRRLGRELAATLAARPELDALDLVRVAAWKLDAGEPDAELCLRASRSALLNLAGVPGSGWGVADSELALRLADAAGPGLEPALSAAGARMALDRFDEVEERLAPLEAEAAAAGAVLAGGYLRTRALSLRWRGDGARALELIERAASWDDGPDWAALRASLRGWILFYDGRPKCAAAEVERLVETPGLAPPSRLDLLVALVTALDRLGLTDRAEALEPKIEALVDELEQAGLETGWARYAVDSQARVNAARGLPGIAERLGAVIERAQGRGDEALAGAMGWAAGRVEVIRGHAMDAARILERAAVGLGSGDPKTALGLCLADLARAHAIRGDAATAAAALGRAEAAGGERPEFRRLGFEIAGARAWVDAARGRPAAGYEQLLAVAEAAGEDLATRVDSLYGALRLGAPPVPCAERLSPLAERMQSELASACAAHARAVAHGDGHAQLAAARGFAELDAGILCAEAATRAARALSLAGREESARDAAALAERHAGHCQGARTPAMERSEELLRLS